MLIEFKFKNGIKFLMPERFFVILDEWAFDDDYEMGYEWNSSTTQRKRCMKQKAFGVGTTGGS